MPSTRRPTPAWLATPAFWPLQIAGWLAFDVAMTTSRIGRFPLAYMAATKGALTVLGALLTALLLRPLYRRLLRDDPPLPRLLAVVVAASYAVAILWTVADHLADVPIAATFLGRTTRYDGIGPLLNGSLYNAFILLAWSVLYVGVKQYLALAAERERALRAEARAHEARLEALRYQLNPHFLFNALNAVSTLVVEGRNAEATRTLARLGDLLRATLERPAAGEVPLADELELLRRYVDVEQVRLGDRLTVSVDVAPDAWAARVPALLLQPLVENAVRHAVAPREEGGRVTVTAATAPRAGGGRTLRLTVSDDGPGIGNGGAPAAAGVGLANARTRLAQLYGDAHRFALGDAEGGGCRIEIELPFVTAAP
jgi:two-component system, LytTR family, sensor kinase